MKVTSVRYVKPNGRFYRNGYCFIRKECARRSSVSSKVFYRCILSPDGTDFFFAGTTPCEVFRKDEKFVEVCVDDFSLACSFYNSVCLDYGFVRSGLYFYDNIQHGLVLVDESCRD